MASIRYFRGCFVLMIIGLPLVALSSEASLIYESLISVVSDFDGLMNSKGLSDLKQSPDSPPEMDEKKKSELLKTDAGRFWQRPDFSGQENSLGYDKAVFEIPEGMKDRVNFWLDIYTKFTTDQGLLHDSRFPTIVYQSVDFSDISNDLELSDHRKAKLKELRIKEQKKIIADRLLKLEKLSSPDGLEGEDLRYWNLFASVSESNKFREASQKGRLRFQLGQRDRFISGIYFSGSYLRKMEEIFRNEGLPIELTRLPFVESSFNVKAQSKVGASGIWQFMRRTGKNYMMINIAVDHRNDPLTATQSAARLLRHYFEMLNSWPLAITGYNHGAYGVKRLTEKMETDDIVELVEKGQKARFGFASQNFYANFLAALIVERDADHYFGPSLQYGPELNVSAIRLERAISYSTLLDCFDNDIERALYFNPHLTAQVRKGHLPIPPKATVYVPSEKVGEIEIFLKAKNIAQKNLMVAMNSKKISDSESDELESSATYKVVAGDTLSDIARQFRTTINRLQSLNGLASPSQIRPGQRLIVPRTQ